MPSLALLCYWATLLHIFTQKRCQWTDSGLFQMLSLTCYVFLRIFPFLCYLFPTGKRCSKQQNCRKPSAMQEAAHQGCSVCMLVSLTAVSLLQPNAHTASHPPPAPGALERSPGRRTLPSAPGPVATHAGIARTEPVPQAQAASRSAVPGLCMIMDSFLLWFVSSVMQKGSQPTPAPCLTALSFSRFERASINYPTIMN